MATACTPPAATLRALLHAWAAQYDTHTALQEKRDGIYQDISYARLANEVEALGTALAARLAPNAHVLIVGGEGYDFVLSYLALTCGACVPVPVDGSLTTERLLQLAAESDATAVLYATGCEERITALPGLTAISLSHLSLLIEEGRTALVAGDHTYLDRSPEPDALATILYTAGTTGHPKGVMLAHRSIVHLLQQAAEMLRINDHDRFLSMLPLSHAYGTVLSVLLPLSAGASVAFGEGMHALRRNMQEVHPTCMVTLPFLADLMLKKYWKTVSKNGLEREVRRIISLTDPIRPYAVRQKLKERLLAATRRLFGGELRRMLVVGDPLSATTQKGLRQIGICAVQGYGLTECAGLAALGCEDACCDGTVGLALFEGMLEIYDTQPDGSGEIRCQGGNVMLGYCKDQALTEEVLRYGWYYTGDIGRIDERGYLHLLGRKENALRDAAGRLICPEELETLLLSSPLVREAAVIDIPDAEGEGRELCAVLVPTAAVPKEIEAAETLMEEWMQHINETLPPYKQLALFTLRTTPLPRNAAGRICRQALVRELQGKM